MQNHLQSCRTASLLRLIRLIVPCLLMALLGCDNRQEAGGGGPGGGPGMMKGAGGGGRATAVRVEAVELGAIDARSTYVAETRPRSDVRLAAEVSGVVEEVNADLGDRVEAGQLLARIRGRTFGQAVREAEASVAHAEAAILRASVDLELAEKERDRAQNLHARGALTRAELDGIEGRYSGAQAALALAEADAQQRRARLERARIDMANTRVLAPFAGFVAERLVDPGALVSPGAQLFRVVDSESVVVRFAAPESDVARLQVGQEVSVDFDAGGIPRSSGRINRISPVVDPKTRTTPVEIVIEAGDRIRPGMFARVTATLESKEDVPLVPAAALVRRQLDDDTEAREGVFVVRDDRAHFSAVEIGLRSRESLEIVNGVSVGDSIVVAGQSDLRHGASLRLVNGGSQGTGAGSSKRGQGQKGS